MSLSISIILETTEEHDVHGVPEISSPRLRVRTPAYVSPSRTVSLLLDILVLVGISMVWSTVSRNPKDLCTNGWSMIPCDQLGASCCRPLYVFECPKRGRQRVSTTESLPHWEYEHIAAFTLASPRLAVGNFGEPGSDPHLSDW